MATKKPKKKIDPTSKEGNAKEIPFDEVARHLLQAPPQPRKKKKKPKKEPRQK